MSSGWVVAGTGSNLTKTVEELLKEKIAAQWAEADPAAAGIEFGTGWALAGILKPYAIHCTHVSTASAPAVNGWAKYLFRALVDVHVFILRTGMSEPAQLRKMQQEVDRIVAQNRTALGQGISTARLVSWRKSHDPANLGDQGYWRAIGQHEMLWYMASSASSP
ncbi:MAG: hypothetical protein AB1753_08900 [Thermoproteota archaeon]